MDGTENQIPDAEVETAAAGQEDSFLDGWDDETPDAVPETEAGPDAGAPEVSENEQEPPRESAEAPQGMETPPEEDGPQNAPQAPAEAPKTWVLNHQGRQVQVGEADLAALAQRGIDSEALRAELDESRPIMDLFRGFAQQAGMPPREYLTSLRVQAMQAKNSMSQEDARRAIDLEDREAAVRQQEAAEQARQAQVRQAQEQARQLEARRQAEVREFLAVFPDAAREQLPGEVWEGVRQGLSLTASYARYSNAKAAEETRAAEEARRRQEAIEKRNAGNAARSAGSMRSAGYGHGPKDPFLAGWDED